MIFIYKYRIENKLYFVRMGRVRIKGRILSLSHLRFKIFKSSHFNPHILSNENFPVKNSCDTSYLLSLILIVIPSLKTTKNNRELLEEFSRRIIQK